MDEQPLIDTRLDQALDDYPMVELPPHFVNRVMAEVRNHPQTHVPEAFRLDYLDFVIPGFLVLFFLLITAVFVSTTNINVDLAILNQNFVRGTWGTAVLLLTIFFEMCLGMIAYFYLWSERY